MELPGIFGAVFEWLTDRLEAWRRIFRAACVVAGPVFLLLAAGSFIENEIFLRNAVAADGIVTANLPQYDKENNSTSYTLVFTFTASDGKSYTMRGDGSSDPPEFAVRQSVPVLYERTNPSRAKIHLFWQFWGLAFAMGIGGIVVTAIGFAMLRYERWLERKGLSLRGASGDRRNSLTADSLQE